MMPECEMMCVCVSSSSDFHTVPTGVNAHPESGSLIEAASETGSCDF